MNFISDQQKVILARIEASFTTATKKKLGSMIKIAAFSFAAYHLYSYCRELKSKADAEVQSFREERDRKEKEQKEAQTQASAAAAEAERKRQREQDELRERLAEATRVAGELREQMERDALKRQQEASEMEDREAHLQACERACIPLQRLVRAQIKKRRLLAIFHLCNETYKQALKGTCEACKKAIKLSEGPRLVSYHDSRKLTKPKIEGHDQCKTLVRNLQARKYFLSQEEYKALTAKGKQREEEQRPVNPLAPSTSSSTLQAPQGFQGGFLNAVAKRLPPIKFADLSNIDDASSFYTHEEDCTLDVLVREYKYFRMGQIGKGRPAFKEGIPRLTPLEFATLEGELEYFKAKKKFPIQFMTSSWADKRKDIVLKQFKFLRFRERCLADGTWDERKDQAKSEASSSSGKKDQKGKQKEKPKTTKKKSSPKVSQPQMPVPPPIMAPAPVDFHTVMQDQEEERSLLFATPPSISSTTSALPALGELRGISFDWSEEMEIELREEAKKRASFLETICVATEARKTAKGTLPKSEKPDGDFGRGSYL